ncbi:MAG: VWA domain-containing protein [Bdellovibrio sp.]|nr:VWA domain-containing protein [Bdellovibrio sp.]
MTFKYWPILLLILLLPVVHRFWLKRNSPPRVFFPVFIPVSVAKKNPTFWLLLFKYLALILFLIALSRPQTSFYQIDRKVNGVDIMMVMDVSDSMGAEDLSEKSRLEVAKETMEQFIRGRKNDRIGFIIFSGEPLTLVPPTLDYGLLLRAIRETQMGKLKQGTAIGDGLSLAVNRLRKSKAKSRVIILLTDGENNVGQVDPATAGDLAAGYGLKVYTIAIGSEGRVLVPVKIETPFGVVVKKQIMENQFNVDLLKQIAQVTQGKFYRVTDAKTLDLVFSEIDQLEKSEVKTHEKVKYNDIFQEPLKWGFCLLIVAQFLELFWWRVLL